MKSLLIFSLLLIASMTFSAAQRCSGQPRNPSCSGNRDVGNRRFGCTARNMWYYDAQARQCRQMRYRGCGGNNNRWCSRANCQRRCVR